ncbi:hypothetical protein AWB78_08017 [Caballeronia calidae]|uniref:Gp5/Type VI secretion system Vgr protein OB-fold domain-containing protein n=1 Tax=Caballeronia calidae TaxID=1777139 RepID=A0A158EHH6_9BURK|nr:hypothetical protein AWB78_08017 [Caballeronia calidae]
METPSSRSSASVTRPYADVETDRLFGKFRGTVLNNQDPLALGRLLVEVPSFSGSPLSWALPCVPFPGPKGSATLAPPIGTWVWIEFEEGDPRHPIWSGYFWTEGQAPLFAVA